MGKLKCDSFVNFPFSSAYSHHIQKLLLSDSRAPNRYLEIPHGYAAVEKPCLSVGFLRFSTD